MIRNRHMCALCGEVGCNLFFCSYYHELECEEGEELYSGTPLDVYLSMMRRLSDGYALLSGELDFGDMMELKEKDDE